MEEPEEQKEECLLILCVDRDNDIGRKTGVRTPIIGKEGNMDSALKLIIADPEEADANAMFEAIRVYDGLSKDETSHDSFEIATIAGSEVGGVAADRKLVSELSGVLEKFHADGLILVTDGYADEDIIPLVQSRVPVTSVRRVVVKHSESIEETAEVFSRYLRMLIEDPRYSRIALGLPGILLIALGTLSLVSLIVQFDVYEWTSYIALTIVGSFLLVKAYGLDKRFSVFASRAYRYSVSGLVAGFSLIAGILLIGVGFYQAGDYISKTFPLTITFPAEIGKLLELPPEIIGWFVSESSDMAVIGVCIVFLGRSIGYLLERDSRFWRTSALVAISAWSWTILNEISQIIIDPSVSPDKLIASIIVGIAIVVSSGLSAHFLGKRYQDMFKEKLEEDEETRAESGDPDEEQTSTG
jgi:putative membrane protein